MWSDNESAIDLLGFQHLLAGISSIVSNEALLPTTIGVFGDWGSGKSSLLKMTQAELEKIEGVLVLSFNGWLFEGYEDAKTALMGTILDEIAAKKTLVPATKHLLAKLFNRINLMQVVGSTLKLALKAGLAYGTGGLPALGLTAGTDLSTTALELAKKAGEIDSEDFDFDKFIKEDPSQNLRRGIREFRKDFAQLLKETKVKTLVVIIDDLDRCMPDTIIETLEAIKLFLFVPRTAFILGADERLVKYAVRRRFPELPGERVEVGRDYLEKLIQFPIRVPALGRTEMETYINFLFFEKAILRTSDEFRRARERVIVSDTSSLLSVRFNYGIAKEILGEVPGGLEEDLSLAQRIAPVLASQLSGNPRQCKRFLNTLVIRLEMARSRGFELKQRVLAKLMLLEYFRPEFFKRLAELQAEQTGLPKELSLAEETINPKEPIAQARDQSSDEGSSSQNQETRTNSSTKRQPVRTSNRAASESQLKEPTLSEDARLLISTWCSDAFMKEWLESEPSLTNENLQPYYFFSRDTLGSLGGAVKRMTPQAQELLKELFQESEALRNISLRKVNEFSQADIAAVFEAISERVQLEEDLGADMSAFNRLCDLVDARRELFSQFITVLDGLPIRELPVWIVLRVKSLATTPQEIDTAKVLLQKWSSSSNTALKTAASQQLKTF